MEEKREKRLSELKAAKEMLSKLDNEINRLNNERMQVISQLERISGAIAQLDELINEE